MTPNDTPTPRCDAECFGAFDGENPRRVVSLDFARTLERDLHAAKAQLAEVERELTDRKERVQYLEDLIAECGSMCDNQDGGGLITDVLARKFARLNADRDALRARCERAEGLLRDTLNMLNSSEEGDIMYSKIRAFLSDKS